MGEKPVRPLVGRTHEMALLEAALHDAGSGRPSIVLITGETGVGKSRLVREFLARARPLALTGACPPMTSVSLPFAPISQALRRLARTARGSGELSRLPELRSLIPASATSAEAAATAATAATANTAARCDVDDVMDCATRTRLFQAALVLLRRLGEPRPVALVVEDLQWADPSTLDLVRFLATNLTDEHAVVVLSTRSDVPVTPHRRWAAELARMPRTRTVQLERLGPQEADELVAHFTGGADPVRHASIVDRSAGNPLFIQHLAWHAGAGAALPETLSELMHSRLRQLSASAGQVVRALCVAACGDPDVLAALLERPVQDVEDDLREAVAQHVLTLDAEGVSFHHPAMAEVADATLMPSERRRLHRASALTLPDLGIEISPVDLAHHWLGGGERGRALEAFVQAAYSAERVGGFAAAYSCYAQAVELCLALECPGVGALSLADLFERGARAAQLDGDEVAAVSMVERAVERTAGRRRAALLERLGSLYHAVGRVAEAEATFQRALSLLESGEVPSDGAAGADGVVLRATVHAGLALLTVSCGRVAQAQVHCALAQEAARQSGATRETGRVERALGLLAAHRGEFTEAQTRLQAALDTARAAGDPDEVSATLVACAHVLGVCEAREEQVRLCLEGAGELDRGGAAGHRRDELLAAAGRALVSLGRYAEADEAIETASSHRPRGIHATPVALTAAELALVRGQTDLALRRCDEADASLHPLSPGEPVQRLRAQVCRSSALAWARRPWEALEASLRGLSDGTDAVPAVDRCLLISIGLRALGDLAQSHRDADSRSERERRCAQLRGLAADALVDPEDRTDVFDSTGDLRGPLGRAVSATVRAELARAEERADGAAWRAAADRWSAIARPFEAAYCRWREAEARLATGGGAGSIAALRNAYSAAVALGAGALAEESGSLARWYRIDLLGDEALGVLTSGLGGEYGGERAREQPETQTADVGVSSVEARTGVAVGVIRSALSVYHLTAREHEVLGGLAAGMSNHELGDELGMSMKTASVHVSNILRKLAVPTRQEAARLAYRHGLTGLAS